MVRDTQFPVHIPSSCCLVYDFLRTKLGARSCVPLSFLVKYGILPQSGYYTEFFHWHTTMGFYIDTAADTPMKQVVNISFFVPQANRTTLAQLHHHSHVQI